MECSPIARKQTRYIVTVNSLDQLSIQSQIKELESTLTGNLFSDMDTRQKIHALKMKLNGLKPTSLSFECVED
jgi:hypothetical protein